VQLFVQRYFASCAAYYLIICDWAFYAISKF